MTTKPAKATFNRIPPDRSMSTHATVISIYVQDTIEHVGRIFETNYLVDALARADYGAPDGQLVRKGHLWVAQEHAVKELAHISQKAGHLRFAFDKLTQGEFG